MENRHHTVTVYGKNDKVVARWHIYDRTEREAEKEAAADVAREHPGCDWSLGPSVLSRSPRSIESRRLRENQMDSEADPEELSHLMQAAYARQAADAFNRIQRECAYCMDSPEDKAAFLDWLKNNRALFPEPENLLRAVQENDSWCCDSELDVTFMLLHAGFDLAEQLCPRCLGKHRDPSVHGFCQFCFGTGRWPELRDVLTYR